MTYLPSEKQLRLVAKYPDELLCLEILWENKFGKPPNICPKCKKLSKFAYFPHGSNYNHLKCSRKYCRYEVNPRTNTIYQHTKTPLVTWFHIQYLLQHHSDQVNIKKLMREFNLDRGTVRRIVRSISTLLQL